jgi:hypothetical protein
MQDRERERERARVCRACRRRHPTTNTIHESHQLYQGARMSFSLALSLSLSRARSLSLSLSCIHTQRVHGRCAWSGMQRKRMTGITWELHHRVAAAAVRLIPHFHTPILFPASVYSVCARSRFVCVCVCMQDRERERERAPARARARERSREKLILGPWYS